MNQGKNNVLNAQLEFGDFLDCHTSCFQTLVFSLEFIDKHAEISKVLLQLDYWEFSKMIENVELYGNICKTCAQRASDIFGKLRIQARLEATQEPQDANILNN